MAEALARIRSSELSPSLAAQVYVVRPPIDTPSGKFLGVAHFQRLLREPPPSWSARVVDTSLEPVGPATPLSTVTRYFATYNLVALPVVDERDRLLGAVTVDDVIDHMLPEDWREADSRRRRRGRGREPWPATPRERPASTCRPGAASRRCGPSTTRRCSAG